jgi:hypothetical protein
MKKIFARMSSSRRPGRAGAELSRAGACSIPATTDKLLTEGCVLGTARASLQQRGSDVYVAVDRSAGQTPETRTRGQFSDENFHS